MRPLLFFILLWGEVSPAQGLAPVQRFQSAWSLYAAMDIEGDPAKDPPPHLDQALDELGRAWAEWMKSGDRGPEQMLLPPLSEEHAPTKPEELQAWKPKLRHFGTSGRWTLIGFEVPVPCGRHTFIALFERKDGQTTLLALDLREPPQESDDLGARENVHAMLLEGPTFLVAGTPPWCTSCWSLLKARVLTPGTSQESPKVLNRFQDGIYRCADVPLIRIRKRPDHIQFQYVGHGRGDQIFQNKQSSITWARP
jgi:hypothetical protein